MKSLLAGGPDWWSGSRSAVERLVAREQGIVQRQHASPCRSGVTLKLVSNCFSFPCGFWVLYRFILGPDFGLVVGIGCLYLLQILTLLSPYQVLHSLVHGPSSSFVTVKLVFFISNKF